MTKAFIYAFSWWRKGEMVYRRWKSKMWLLQVWMHALVSALWLQKSEGWILRLGPNSLLWSTREERQDACILGPSHNNVEGDHHPSSSPLTPWSTPAVQGVLTLRRAGSPGWTTLNEAGPQRKLYIEKFWRLLINKPRPWQRYLPLKCSTELC